MPRQIPRIGRFLRSAALTSASSTASTRGSVGSELGMRLLAVDARLEVGAAGEADAVDPVEQRRDRVGAQQRHDHRDAAGALDRLRISRGQRHLELGRLALRPRDDILRPAELGGA